jgi:gliding motility-associated-like protein
LSINSATGEINIAASSPGAYTVTYTLVPIASSCQLGGTNTAQIVINSPIAVTASGECQGTSFVLTASPVDGSFNPETADYEWRNGSGIVIGFTQSVTATEIGNYTVTVTSDGCSSTSAPFSVDNVGCSVQKGISANGDGLNDFFDLHLFDVKKLTIFNRFGMEVYGKNQYKDEWMGQSNKGDNLPDGTYYYVIEFNTATPVKTGWIYINRAN